MKRRKLLYICALISVVILNCLYVNYEFFLLLVMVTAVPVVSWVLFLLSRIQLRLFVKVERTALMVLQKLQLRITGDSWFPKIMYWGRLGVQIRYSNSTAVEKRNVSVQPFMKKRYKNILEINTQHCGIVSIYMDELEVRDMLQLFSVRYDYNVVRQAVVFPRRLIVDSAFQESREQEEEYVFSHVQTDNTEVLGLRSYVDGDPINRIHWKRSMNSEDFIVRQYGEEVEKRISIIVDLTLNEDEAFRDNLDLIYEAAYSIAGFYADREYASRFVAWDEMKNAPVLLDFDNLLTMNNRMAQLMSIRCCPHAAERIDANYGCRMEIMKDRPVFVTAQDYESPLYLVVNVKKDALCDVLADLGRRLR